MDNLEQRIEHVEQRNKRVEIDKIWETSWTRRFLVALFTYLAIGVYLWVIDIPLAWLHAIVPTLAFMISTLTMPFLKRVWIRRQERDREAEDKLYLK